jgi:hypothetical protein
VAVDERPAEQLTLRERFTSAEWLIRELLEHLEQNFLPKSRAVEELVRSHARADERREFADTTVRTRVAALLASDDFSQTLLNKLERLLTAIDEGAHQAITER